MISNKSHTSNGVLIVSVSPPRWTSLATNDQVPLLRGATIDNVFVYNFFTQDERYRYNGFGRESSPPNPFFSVDNLNNTADIYGHSLIADGNYRMVSSKVPCYIKLSWEPPAEIDVSKVASAEVITAFKKLVNFDRTRRSKDSDEYVIAPMKHYSEYSNFESQQNDYVRVTNVYLDMFSGIRADGTILNEWYAEEIDSTAYDVRRRFLWDKVIADDQKYKNFLSSKGQGALGTASTSISTTSTNQGYDDVFNNSANNDPVSVVNVSDSALLENLNFPQINAIPEDITVVHNSNLSWKTKILSHGFSGQILGIQSRIKEAKSWAEFMKKVRPQSTAGDIQQILGRTPGPVETCLIKGKPFIVQTNPTPDQTDMKPFMLVGFVIEKEQILEPGEQDEPGMRPSEKFPLIFVPCSNDTHGNTPHIATSYLDAAINYDKEYKYTIRAIYSFSITVPKAPGSSTTQTRHYLVNSTYSTVLKIETREVTPPTYPRDLGAFYDFYKRGLALNWAFPVNPQRDTAYFAIFRRGSIYEPFRLLQVYDFNYSISSPQQSREEIKFLLEYSDYHNPEPGSPPPNNFHLVKRMTSDDAKTAYVDTGFKKGKDYIYAVCAIDAHGQMSNYSSQLKVNLDSKTHKLLLRQISPPGAPLVFPNWFIESKAFVDVARTARYRRAVVKFRPDYKKVKHGPGNDIKNIVKTIDTKNGGNAKNCYYLQILNPDRQEDIVLKYQIDDSLQYDISLLEERDRIAELAGVTAKSISRKQE